MADDPVPPEEGDPAGEPASDGNEETDSSLSEETIQSLLLFYKELDENELEPYEPQSSEESVQPELKLEDLGLSNEKLVYVNRVKNALEANSNEYPTFSKLVVKHETQRIGSLRFRRWARWLLRDHTELIMGLNIFLPQEIHITEPSPTEYEYELFRDFLKLVQKRYTDFIPRIKTFGAIFRDSEQKKITESEAYSRIAHLFRDGPELVLEFKKPDE